MCQEPVINVGCGDFVFRDDSAKESANLIQLCFASLVGFKSVLLSRESNDVEDNQ